MIEGRLIICIASDWDYDPTSKHHIMRILARRNDVVWVNYRGSRRPELSRADAKTALTTLSNVLRGVRRVSRSMVQVTPLVIPGASSPALQRLHERLVIAQIQRAVAIMDPHGTKPVQLWSFAPDVPYLAERFNEECFVYYCVDDFGGFEGYDKERIQDAERLQLDAADVVITSSDALWEAKRLHRADAILLSHGVDYEHFASAWRWEQSTPTDVASLRRPIFGYFGLIHHWVDLDWLRQVAQLRPQYSFVMIGECRIDTTALRNVPNVHFLGRRPYELLPAYCAAFNAGMMLFKRNEMTRHVNPIKMHEYLAAGLPVVSTPLPEARRYPGVIRIAETPAAYAGACDELARGRAVGEAQAVSRLVENQTWEEKVALLSRIVVGSRDRHAIVSQPAAHVLRRALRGSEYVFHRTPSASERAGEESAAFEERARLRSELRT